MLVLVFTLGLASFVLGCGDDHAHQHSHSRRASPSWSIAPPSRPLEWGDLNVIHTTDSHGWLLGHQEPSVPEPNYSGTFGDFASFVAHMKLIAEEKGVDLLLVDSGDLHDGTGLSDGYPPGGVDAHETNQFIKQLPYDVLAIGNHELYVYNNTLDMHTDFAPHWNGRYLSSNANITVPSPSDPSINVSVPVGERYAKFETARGRRVTSLGVLFDFTGNDEGTSVQKVEDMVKEQWFADAIADEPDLFLLVGHMPVATRDNWPVVHAAIRAVHPETPILIFGGHTHVRDCVQYDGRSMALESGRYMETVGWASVKFDGDHANPSSSSSSTGNLTFSRRYLDANRLTYEFHTNRNNQSFDTRSGLSITRGLEDLAVRFDLNFTYGIAPQDYTITRAPYPSNGSSLTLFIEQAVPIALATNTSQNSSTPAVYLTNSGSQRFDIFKGPFTKNDQLTTSPFLNAFVFVGNVSFGVAREVVDMLNEVGGEVSKRDLGEDEERYRRGDVEMRYRAWLEEMYAREVARALERREEAEAQKETLGYVTSDSCPGIGDDTPHIAVPSYKVPAYISSIDSFTNSTNSSSSTTVTSNSSDSTESGPFPPGILSTSDPVDLIFADFIASDVLSVLNSLQSDKVFIEDDVASYSLLLTNEVLGVFAGIAWN